MPATNQNVSRWVFFAFFFVSGFCSLVYQVIWTRLAFASFGIITPVLSVVISVFMLGLSLGSWAGGRLAIPLARRTGLSAAIFYAAAEFIIGLSAYAVPPLFSMGEHVLLASGGADSFRYLFLSAVILAISILPWCVFMGATFPFMMAYIRETNEGDTDSFSYLYVANVLGAMCGTFLTAVAFVEIFGFRTTLHLAAGGNFIIALLSLLLGARRSPGARAERTAEPKPSVTDYSSQTTVKWILFSTGFSAIAMEVVWTRLFTPVLKTQVYSFALVVFVYLGATLAGSLLYRRHLKEGRTWKTPFLIALLAISVFLPVPASDPRFVHMDILSSMHPLSMLIVLASIFPFCAVLGYLTPGLIDNFCLGNPAKAGRAYAINVLGCILGPLVASYLLLPLVSERSALFDLSLPVLGFYFFFWKSLPRAQRLWSGAACGLLVIYSLAFSHNFADAVAASSSRIEVRRDYAASVISADPDGDKKLFVNGIGMTTLTPITKFMIHLPMAYHNGPAHSALVICFGMGTSYRSALSWNVDTTVVELVPAVPKAFGYYHNDAAEVLRNPRGRIVIDDGRRFLKRTQQKYDVIATDPPPPLEAAGSSLLYSTEFYDEIKQHLQPNGIVQIWVPPGEKTAVQAVVRSVFRSFPHVRCFPSVQSWGVHLLASLTPIEEQTPEQLAARMPERAKKDLLEWAPDQTAPAYLEPVVTREIVPEILLNTNVDVQITDDDPMNEYFLLRRTGLF
jgi:spermidine synthase/MFS family permease